MGTGWKYNKKPLRRPRKSEGERRRRVKTQRARLVKLGVAEEKVSKMNPKRVRTLLQRPKNLKKNMAKATPNPAKPKTAAKSKTVAKPKKSAKA